MSLRPSLRIVAFVAILMFSFGAGYWLRGVVVWLSASDRPIVHTDVAGEELVRLGFPFGRPAGATNVVTAIAGNGLGDVVVYASFDLPPNSVRDFMRTLQSEKGFKSILQSAKAPHETQSDSVGVYLDQLPKAVADSLWPRSGFEHAERLHGSDGRNGVEIVHLQGTRRIHAASICCTAY